MTAAVRQPVRRQSSTQVHRAKSGSVPSVSRANRSANRPPSIQQVLGNQAAQRVIQPKLTVSQPNDKFEQEADRVADQVMRIPEPTSGEAMTLVHQAQTPKLQRACAQCKDEIQRQPMEEDEEVLQTKRLSNREPSVIQRQVGAEEEEELLQTKRAPGEAPVVTPDIASGIRNQQQSSGQSLPLNTRAFIEPRFGRHFGSVRTHTGPKATELARSLNARAFTLQNDIFFAPGEFQPHTPDGIKLLTHELTHTVQQTGGQLLTRNSHLNENQGLLQRAPEDAMESEEEVKPNVPQPQDTTPPEQKTELIEQYVQVAIGGSEKKLPTIQASGPFTLNELETLEKRLKSNRKNTPKFYDILDQTMYALRKLKKERLPWPSFQTYSEKHKFMRGLLKKAKVHKTLLEIFVEDIESPLTFLGKSNNNGGHRILLERLKNAETKLQPKKLNENIKTIGAFQKKRNKATKHLVGLAVDINAKTNVQILFKRDYLLVDFIRLQTGIDVTKMSDPKTLKKASDAIKGDKLAFEKYINVLENEASRNVANLPAPTAVIFGKIDGKIVKCPPLGKAPKEIQDERFNSPLQRLTQLGNLHDDVKKRHDKGEELKKNQRNQIIKEIERFTTNKDCSDVVLDFHPAREMFLRNLRREVRVLKRLYDVLQIRPKLDRITSLGFFNLGPSFVNTMRSSGFKWGGTFSEGPDIHHFYIDFNCLISDSDCTPKVKT